MEENKNIQDQNQEQEIDLIELALRLWKKRVFIIKVTAVFMVLGLFVALFSPKVYTSSCTFVPQASKKSGGGSLSSLAAMAGISLGDMSEGATLSPKVYPKILNNIDFKKELMYSKVKFEGWDEPVALIDYYTDKKYAKFNLLGAVKKYTIGLPFVILKAIRGEGDTTMVVAGPGSGIESFSAKEFECAKILSKAVSLTLNDKEGYITISSSMPEALAAAELTQTTFELLEKYVTEFKIAKAKDQLKFVTERYAELKVNFEEKQAALAEFQDANRIISSAKARTEEERLKNEYSIANIIFQEMAKQMVQASIQVKEDTPILTAVEPVTVPYKKAKPKRATILVIWTFLGGVLACGSVFGLDFLKKQGAAWPKNWELE